MPAFSDVVDAVDSLTIDEQATLLEILQRRIAAENRAALLQEVAEARAEFKNGTTRTTSVGELMDEVRSEA